MSNKGSGPSANTLAKYKTDAAIAQYQLKALSKGKRKRSTKKRRKRPQKRRGLSELYSPAQARKSGMAMGMSTVGGFMAGMEYKMLQANGVKKLPGFLALAATGFLASTVMKAPAIGNGFGGALGFLLSQESGLGEGWMYSNEDMNMNDAPMYLDEHGNPMYLDENGYLSEEDESIYLADQGNESPYPAYANVEGYGWN